MISSFYSMIQTIPRSHAMSLLPVIVDAKAEVYIKTTEEEAISWHAYINPFSNEMWFMCHTEMGHTRCASCNDMK